LTKERIPESQRGLGMDDLKSTKIVVLPSLSRLPFRTQSAFSDTFVVGRINSEIFRPRILGAFRGIKGFKIKLRVTRNFLHQE